jgi:hypothetical protein
MSKRYHISTALTHLYKKNSSGSFGLFARSCFSDGGLVGLRVSMFLCSRSQDLFIDEILSHSAQNYEF